MIRIFILALFVVLAFRPAAAENPETLCRLLPVAAGSMAGAEFVPGIDVHGAPVVPADAGAAAPSIAKVIRFPVSLDLAQQQAQPLPPGAIIEAPVALVEIYNDGRVLYNGYDLTAQAYVLCGEMYSQAVPVPVQKPAPEKIIPEDILWGEGY